MNGLGGAAINVSLVGSMPHQNYTYREREVRSRVIVGG